VLAPGAVRRLGLAGGGGKGPDTRPGGERNTYTVCTCANAAHGLVGLTPLRHERGIESDGRAG
jgi:hypothetical protein